MIRSRMRPLASIAVLASILTAAYVAVLARPVAGHASSTVRAVGNCSAGSGWGEARQDLVDDILGLVNAHRRARGLHPLRLSPTLTHAALWKARNMAEYQYLAHADPAPPVARTVAQRLAACRYPSWSSNWSENIAYGFGTPARVMRAWLTSPHHREAIEEPSFRVIGIGAASAGDIIYWAQDFGSHDDAGDGVAVAAEPVARPAPVRRPPTATRYGDQPAPAKQEAAKPKKVKPKTTTPKPAKPEATKPERKAPRPTQSVVQPRPVRAPSLPVAADLDGATSIVPGPMVAAERSPRAGERFVQGVVVLRPDTHAMVTWGQVSCRAEIGGVPLRVVINAFKGGLATCAWRVPAGMQGQWLGGTIGVHAGELRTSRVFARKILRTRE